MTHPPLANPAGLWTRAFPYLVGAAIAATAVAGLVRREPDLHRGFVGLVYLGVLAFIATYDTKTMRAPNRVVYPALAFAVVVSASLGWADAAEALLGGIAAFSATLVLAVVGRGAMGFGDVKVAALCGMAVGLQGVVPMLALALIGGACIAGPALALRIRKRIDSFAFTPLLAAATAFSMLCYPLYLW